MKTILITRPKEEADSLAGNLTAMGFFPFSEPMLRIEPVQQSRPLLEAALKSQPQAILITSRQALRLLSEMTAIRDIPLLLVGAETARNAASLGFQSIHHCETAGELDHLVMRHCKPDGTPLLYARGEFTSADIAATLAGKGFHVDSVVLYRAHAANEFSRTLRELIADRQLTAALFFSRRTAEIYTKLAQAHDLAQPHNAMIAVCMSEAIAAGLHTLPWAAIRIAGTPDMEHMLKLVETL